MGLMNILYCVIAYLKNKTLENYPLAFCRQLEVKTVDYTI